MKTLFPLTASELGTAFDLDAVASRRISSLRIRRCGRNCGREFLAIEVKATDRYHTALLEGPRAVDGLAKLARRLLVYTGTRSFRTEDGIDVWPLRRLNAAVADGSVWP